MLKQRTTREDVAREAGVSKTAVTYVLRDRQDIAIPESTRERVRSVARRLGYQPHAAAQALASGRTSTIAVALPIKIGSHYAHVLQALERQIDLHGFHMMASTIGHVNIENVQPDLHSVMNSLSDGVILVDMPTVFRPNILASIPTGKAVVSIGVFTVPDVDSVVIDLSRGVQTALDHLLESKRTRIAFFGNAIHVDGAVVDTFAEQGALDPRPFAYCEAMRRNNRRIEMIAGNCDSRSESMASIKSHIAAFGCPDALFCFNDEMAIAASRALREAGFRVPEDILLVGCDGSEESEYMNPALSTIVQPIDQMCQEAWTMIRNRLQNPEFPRQSVTVHAEFVQRRSSSGL